MIIFKYKSKLIGSYKGFRTNQKIEEKKDFKMRIVTHS